MDVAENYEGPPKAEEKVTGKSGLDLTEVKMSIIEAVQKDLAFVVEFRSVKEVNNKTKKGFIMDLLLKKLKPSFGSETGSRRRINGFLADTEDVDRLHRKLLAAARGL